MNKRILIVLIGVGLLVTSGLIASNMGFKLNYLLQAGDGGVNSATGTNTIALPYNAQAGINNTGDLANDIGGFTTTGGPVQEVQTFLRSTDGFNVYTGAKGQTADPITPGVGYRVKVASDTNYIVAGSHNPGLGIDLYAAGDTTPDGVSATGTNAFAVPYHSTAADTGQLVNDIGGFTTTGGPVQEVQTFLRSTDGFNVYTGAKGQTADPITPGASVRIKMGTTDNYIPSHY